MKLKLRVVRSELEPGLVVRSESECSEIETTFTGNLWLPVGDSNNAGRRKLRHQRTADQGGIKCKSATRSQDLNWPWSWSTGAT